jgi:hypothetical protein
VIQEIVDSNFDLYKRITDDRAPASAIKLAAEILWVMYLIIHRSASSASTKRLQIHKVFGWSGEEIDPEHWALGDVLDAGVAHPGTAYQTHRWRELVFFIDFLSKWTALDRPARLNLLDEPWTFARWLNAIEGASHRQLPHILCFLLFPDSFERIASGRHKRDIVKAFADHLSDDAPETYADRDALDRALLRVREGLAEQYGSDLDFYESPVAEKWRKKPAPPPPDDAEDKQWLEERFGGHRVWVLAAGEGGRMWSDFLRNGIAAIGWDWLGDATLFSTREAVAKAITEETGKEKPDDGLARRVGVLQRDGAGRRHPRAEGYGRLPGARRRNRSLRLRRRSRRVPTHPKRRVDAGRCMAHPGRPANHVQDPDGLHEVPVLDP